MTAFKLLDGGIGSPGYQGTERSGITATVYRQGNDPFISVQNVSIGGAYPLDGATQASGRPAVMGLSTQKTLNGAAGTFTLQLKCGPKVGSLFDSIVDDDWIDIHLKRGGITWHIMRGVVDDLRRDETVSGSGTTVETWSLTGRDFQSVYEKTPIFFSTYNSENVLGAAAYQILQAPNQGGSVAQTVKLFLQGFLAQQGNYGRSLWQLPDALPNTLGTFTETVQLYTDNYTDLPPRNSLSTSFKMPEGMVWDLAKQWCDPMFCEMFTELYPATTFTTGQSTTDDSDVAIFSEGNTTPGGSNTEQMNMTTVLRDKPFPMVDPQIPIQGGPPVGMDSAWFSLPMFKIPREYITQRAVGRSGYERSNAYFVTPQLAGEFLRSQLMLLCAPLWSPAEMLTHGMRRFDVVSRYLGTGAALTTMPVAQRLMLRDWYCANAYWLNGTITFGVGLPNLRVGCRLRIPGSTTAADDETYYIEAVNHTWSPQQGLRTTVTVTRGFRGSDSDLLACLQALTANYAVAGQSPPSSGGTP